MAGGIPRYSGIGARSRVEKYHGAFGFEKLGQGYEAGVWAPVGEFRFRCEACDALDLIAGFPV